MNWQTISLHAHCDTSQDNHCLWSWAPGIVDERAAYDAARAHADDTGHRVLVERHQVTVVTTSNQTCVSEEGR